MKGRIISINVSQRKGVAKTPVREAELKLDYGLVGDVHATSGPRQVSLLSWESIQKQNKSLTNVGSEEKETEEKKEEDKDKEKEEKKISNNISRGDNNHKRKNNGMAETNICPKFGSGTGLLQPGDFAENLTTEGIELSKLKMGDQIVIQKDIKLEVTKIGKECHRYCAIYYRTGDCIMPREGIFCRVLRGGKIKIGDSIEINSL